MGDEHLKLRQLLAHAGEKDHIDREMIAGRQQRL